ncbi:hypothetical protein M422DRAFT_195694, partial [Sphaerobolus stellatus SS14]
TRWNDPSNPAQIEEIILKIDIGPDFTDKQRRKVLRLVYEFVDTFALSLSEVIPVSFM